MLSETVIECKSVEYSARFVLAYRLGDYAKARKLALMELVACRLQSRQAHAKVMDKQAEARALRRSVRLAENEGVAVPLAQLRVRKLEAERDAAEKELACVGERMFTTLQLWQSVGAAFEDLCNLCNRTPAQVREMIARGSGDDDLPLCDLALIYNLDYKSPRDTGWLEDSVDAPLTHALKAYMLDAMLHTEAGKKAAHEAMQAVFPGIMENALTEYTDADGVRRLIDKDGNEFGIADSEERE